jgi:hypothetical protein
MSGTYICPAQRGGAAAALPSGLAGQRRGLTDSCRGRNRSGAAEPALSLMSAPARIGALDTLDFRVNLLLKRFLTVPFGDSLKDSLKTVVLTC